LLTEPSQIIDVDLPLLDDDETSKGTQLPQSPQIPSLPSINHGNTSPGSLSSQSGSDDGVDDSPSTDFYSKKPFAAAAILLPLFIGILAVTTIGKFTTWRVIVFNILLAPVYFCIFTTTSLHMEYWGRKLPRKLRWICKLIPFLAFSPFVVECIRLITNYAFAVSLVIVIPLFLFYVIWCIVHGAVVSIKYRIRRQANTVDQLENNQSILTSSKQSNITTTEINGHQAP